MTNLQVLQIAMKFLLQIVFAIRILLNYLELNAFEWRKRNKDNPNYIPSMNIHEHSKNVFGYLLLAG